MTSNTKYHAFLLHIFSLVARSQEFAVGENFEIEYRIQDAQRNWHWFYDRSISRQLEDDEIIIEGLAKFLCKINYTSYFPVKSSQLSVPFLY
ncbi:hypothetical protein [Dapis sp. BLCC M229]|uniref:hypothetical protein n=1 Tax=Dapis sp. BLCC M229 TaxID=3400188 RepID=UPI003CE864EE